MFFKKRSWVRFFNLVPGVEMTHPIVPANEYRYSWLSEVAKDFRDNQKNTGTHRCPGIVDFLHKGFIVTAPFDFTILTNRNDNENFEWATAVNMKNFIDAPYIGRLTKETLSNFVPFRSDTLKTIIKVNTFWRSSSSDDIVLLQMPIAYPDHNIFTACTGIIDPDKYLELIVQLQWHKLDGQYTIKAGTPLCQLIPIPKKLAVDLVVDKLTPEDEYLSRAHKYLVTHAYRRNLTLWKNTCKIILDKLRKNKK